MVKNLPVMQETQVGCSRITADVTAAMKLKDTCSMEEKL